MAIDVKLDLLLVQRRMTLTELSGRIGITLSGCVVPGSGSRPRRMRSWSRPVAITGTRISSSGISSSMSASGPCLSSPAA